MVTYKGQMINLTMAYEKAETCLWDKLRKTP